jgi:hypothetical protein
MLEVSCRNVRLTVPAHRVDDAERGVDADVREIVERQPVAGRAGEAIGVGAQAGRQHLVGQRLAEGQRRGRAHVDQVDREVALGVGRRVDDQAILAPGSEYTAGAVLLNGRWFTTTPAGPISVQLVSPVAVRASA